MTPFLFASMLSQAEVRPDASGAIGKALLSITGDEQAHNLTPGIDERSAAKGPQ